jgi:hypothetical protein
VLIIISITSVGHCGVLSGSVMIVLEEYIPSSRAEFVVVDWQFADVGRNVHEVRVFLGSRVNSSDVELTGV